MKKVNLAHYKNLKENFYYNGGKMLIYDKEVVIKGFIKKIAVFDMSNLQIKVLPNHTMGYKVIEISDDHNSFECLLFKKDFEKMSKCLLK